MSFYFTFNILELRTLLVACSGGEGERHNSFRELSIFATVPFDGSI
jgi:hypothetical protein